MRFLIIVSITLALAWNSFQDDVKECYEEGLFCESCQNVVRCIQSDDSDENATFTKTGRESCGNGLKCLNGTCTDAEEPICDGTAEVTFVCNNVTIFPHPFYCNKYVLCIDDWGLKPYVAECEYGYGYDITTANCDVKLTGNQCMEEEYPVPLCETPLQSGPLEDDPTIYYTCEEVNKDLFTKVLYPVLRRCPHGQVYTESGLCEDK